MPLYAMCLFKPLLAAWTAHEMPVKRGVSKAKASKAKRPRTSSLIPYVYPPRYTPEVKFFDSVFAAATIPAGAASLIDASMLEIVNGSGPSARLGRKIRVVRVDYSFSIVLVGSAAILNPDAYRFDIWLDKQCNGTAATAGDLYMNAGGVPGTCQFRNLSNEKRFKRLVTVTRELNGQTGVAVSNALANVGHKYDGTIYPKLEIEYEASTGAIADITSNNLFYSWSSDNGTIYCFAVNTRVYFVDA